MYQATKVVTTLYMAYIELFEPTLALSTLYSRSSPFCPGKYPVNCHTSAQFLS